MRPGNGGGCGETAGGSGLEQRRGVVEGKEDGGGEREREQACGGRRLLGLRPAQMRQGCKVDVPRTSTRQPQSTADRMKPVGG